MPTVRSDTLQQAIYREATRRAPEGCTCTPTLPPCYWCQQVAELADEVHASS
jgi:hypothetical protein